MTHVEEFLSDLSGRRDEYLALLEAITVIESHTSQRGGVEAVATVLLARLASIGFEAEVVPQPGAPEGLEWVAEVMSPGVDYGLLGDSYVTRRPGSGTDQMLLLGDLDTAFLPGSIAEFPFRVDGVLARGPGVADMKGGLVVLVAALESLHTLGRKTPPVTVVLSGDEQAGSLGSRRTIEHESASARWAFCVESARQGGRLMGARGQVGVGRLTVVGREAYAGDPSDHGANAIAWLAELVPLINRLGRPDQGVLVSINLIEGGRRRSVIPARATAIIDVRTPSNLEWERTASALCTAISGADIAAEASLDLYSHRPALEWTSTTERMLEFLRSVGTRLGLTVEAIRSPAAGSSAFAAGKGVATFDGMGPVGGGIMTNDEHVVIDSIAERGALLAAAIDNISHLSL